MNLNEYIASGIIESYVMGLASGSERKEFEEMCAQHPELVAERRKFEEGLESYASRQAERPPQEIRAKVLNAIGTMENADNPHPRIIGMLRFAIAAAVILLIGMVVLYYQMSRKNEQQNITIEQLKDKLDTTQKTLDQIADERRILVQNPTTTVVNMVGTKISPGSSANVYWDSAGSSVYLVVKNMPLLPSDRQYQLWALIDNKPTDLGVFDASDKNVILKMKDTKKAQAFAITIERKGGSPTPHLDSLQSLTHLSQ